MAVMDALSPADEWLGQGVRLPFRPTRTTNRDPQAQGLTLVSGMELVRQSIETILDTEPGERVMLPAFGCGLRRYLMAPNTTSVRTSIQAEVTQALTTWEPRILLTEVSVTAGDDPTLIWIDISYLRRVDLRPDNLVYPFYLR
jgi:phage baseplate assembly protein W